MASLRERKKKIEKEICIKTSVCLFQLYPFEVTVLLKKESIFCIRAMIKVSFRPRRVNDKGDYEVHIKYYNN